MSEINYEYLLFGLRTLAGVAHIALLPQVLKLVRVIQLGSKIASDESPLRAIWKEFSNLNLWLLASLVIFGIAHVFSGVSEIIVDPTSHRLFIAFNIAALVSGLVVTAKFFWAVRTTHSMLPKALIQVALDTETSAMEDRRMRDVLLSTSLIVYEADENGIITYSAGAALSDVGWKEHEAVGGNLLTNESPRNVPLDIGSKERKCYMDILSGRVEKAVFSKTIKMGRKNVHLLITVYPLRRGGLRGVAINVTDSVKMFRDLSEDDVIQNVLRRAIEST